jgi:hypothetical protein
MPEPALVIRLREIEMHKTSLIRNAGFFTVLLLLFGNAVLGQERADRPRQAAMRSFAYDATQETVLEGTVLSYAAEAATPPIGAHAVLQTASGSLDVHLGAGSYLQGNHFSLAKGDSVRVVGVNSPTRQGTIFLVRVIQKGGQSLALRTAKGAPLSRAGARALSPAQRAQLATQEGPR